MFADVNILDQPVPPGSVLLVSGAGTDYVNGYYKQDGESSGKPQFKKACLFILDGISMLTTFPHLVD